MEKHMANTKTPLISAALSHLALERVAAAIIEVPDTKPQQYVAIGTAATISMLLEIDGLSAAIKSWSERMPAPWQEPVCSMNCSPPCTSKERESCGDCAIVTRHGDPIKARDEEIAELRTRLAAFEGTKGGQA
jgi:hypothetical protein